MVATKERLIQEIVRVVSVTGISYTELRNMDLIEYDLVRAEARKISKEGKA
jgi:hypothetical protein